MLPFEDSNWFLVSNPFSLTSCVSHFNPRALLRLKINGGGGLEETERGAFSVPPSPPRTLFFYGPRFRLNRRIPFFCCHLLRGFVSLSLSLSVPLNLVNTSKGFVMVLRKFVSAEEGKSGPGGKTRLG